MLKSKKKYEKSVIFEKKKEIYLQKYIRTSLTDVFLSRNAQIIIISILKVKSIKTK